MLSANKIFFQLVTTVLIHSILRGRLEESSAKFKYIKDLHEAYENWLMEKMFPYQPPILKVIDAHMKPEEIYQQIETIISRL